MNIKVSIIVPIYKVPENFLIKCIESLKSQTLKEIEIILVDDGSPDNCGKICDKYAKNDDRIKVVHQNNKGLSAARNTGYKKASGQWITFVDGDDWIENNMCEYLYSHIQKGIDITCCGVIKDYGNKQYYYQYDTKYQDNKLYTDKEIKYMQKELLDYNGNNAWAYAKLINKEFLNKYNIMHDEELRQGAEALEFNLRMFEKAKRNIIFKKIFLPLYVQ